MDQLVVCDSRDWSGSTPGAGDWSVAVVLSGPTQSVIPGSIEGGLWVARLLPAASAVLQPGRYDVAVQLSSGSVRSTRSLGRIQLLPDPTSQAAGTDVRSLAERALDECRAALAQFRSSGGRVASYTIAGRSMAFSGIGELIDLERYWRARVDAEREEAAARSGAASPRNLYVRFVRP